MQLTAELIEGFVSSVLIKRFDDAAGIPQFHKELWGYACADDKCVAIAAPRGHAKSTAGTLAYALAAILFRANRFVVIVSDTESQAAMFLGNLKQELADNETLADLFLLTKDEKGVVFAKETETDLIVTFQDGHKCRVIAKGAEQKLRGMNWDGTRPDLIICDDLENDELVMNKERREKLRRWFFGALLPALSPKGRIRVWGTILHSDSLLESFMPKENDKAVVEVGLKMFSRIKRGMWLSAKYRAHDGEFKELLWPERFSKEFFMEKQKEFTQQGISDVYSQEYLNRPIDDSVAYFKKRDFLSMSEEDLAKPMVYYITGDLAISEKEKADYTVFVVGGVDEDRRLHVINVVKERMDGREIVDTILALHRTYEPEAIGLEEMQISKAIGPFLREEMIAQNTFPNMVPMKHMNKDKLSRARSIQARVRARTVKFDKEADWYTSFEDELLKFPRSARDDQVDAFAYLGLLLDKIVAAPTREEIDEEEYDSEYNESGLAYAGRSIVTGY